MLIQKETLPSLLLAPMASLTHAPFRELVAYYGGVDLFFTEMLNIRALVYQNPFQDPYLIQGEKDRPLMAQLVGREPKLFAQAVQKLEENFNFAGYDLNFGCARGALQRYGWGVSIMKDPSLAQEIVLAVMENTPKPVSVKIRSGFQHHRETLLSFVEKLVRVGVQMVTLHPRTASEGFKRPARWEEIKWLTEEFEIPIVGNGDVFSPQDALKMFHKTSCAGIMLGRAALLRPWIFRDIRKFFLTGKYPPPPSPLEPLELFYSLILRYLPPELRERRFELWLFWYLQNFAFGIYYFKEAKKKKGLEAQIGYLRKALAQEKFKDYPAKPFLNR